MHILVVGGGMANTFLFAQGTQIGKSLCEKNLKETTQRIISKAIENNCEIILPHDVVVASEFSANANFSIKNVKNHQNKKFQQAYSIYQGWQPKAATLISIVPAGIPHFDDLFTFLMVCWNSACACRHAPFCMFLYHLTHLTAITSMCLTQCGNFK